LIDRDKERQTRMRRLARETGREGGRERETKGER